jgi:hypothetical protein
MSITKKKNAKPSPNGKPAKKAALPAPEEGPELNLPFSNYAGKQPLGIDDICKSLKRLTGGWPKCISGMLCYVVGSEVRVLEDAAALFAWIGGHAPVEWRRGARAGTKEEFFKRLNQRRRWKWSTPYPHFPELPGVLYLTEAPEAKHTGKLDKLVDRFRPKTDKDRELIKAFILTLFWGGPPGKRPQFVIASEEYGDPEAGRGTGKTTLVQYLAELVGGCIDVDPSGDRGRILSNLLSPSSWGQRIALIDNLKTSRFSDDFLERLVTRTEITGHRLYRGFATRPNLLTWVVTVNGAFFSTDEARRSVVICLARPSKKPSDWDGETLEFLRENREAILADVRWHLEVKKPQPLTKVDTWGPWCQGVLSRCKEPDALLKHILKQRASIDADKMDVELALDHLRGCMVSYFEETYGKVLVMDNEIVWAPTAWLSQALRSLYRDLTERRVQLLLRRLTSSGRLYKCDHKVQRGYRYVGENVDLEDPPVEHFILYRPEAPGLRKK